MAFYIPIGMECVFLHYNKFEPDNTLAYWQHRDWCLRNEIWHRFDGYVQENHLPTKIWLLAEDAVAFKLTFKL